MYSRKEIDVLWLKPGAWLGRKYKHMLNSNDTSWFVCLFFCIFASISCLIKSSGDLCFRDFERLFQAEFKKRKNNMDFQSTNQFPELNGLSPSNLGWFFKCSCSHLTLPWWLLSDSAGNVKTNEKSVIGFSQMENNRLYTQISLHRIALPGIFMTFQTFYQVSDLKKLLFFLLVH